VRKGLGKLQGALERARRTARPAVGTAIRRSRRS
jgi:hypothetical protein